MREEVVEEAEVMLLVVDMVKVVTAVILHLVADMEVEGMLMAVVVVIIMLEVVLQCHNLDLVTGYGK
jgi:hypothetical protein